MKKILILGSEGFLGSVLVPYLITKDKIFVGVDKCFFGRNNIPSKNFTLYKKDYNYLSKKFFGPIFIRGFGIFSVNGRIRLPKPAARIMAFLIVIEIYFFSTFLINSFV